MLVVVDFVVGGVVVFVNHEIVDIDDGVDVVVIGVVNVAAVGVNSSSRRCC